MAGRHRRERNLPPHLQDQADAAERDARRELMLKAIELHVPVEVGEQGSDPNFDLVVSRLGAAAEAGDVRQCPHLGRMIQPAFVRAWDRPYTFRCDACDQAEQQHMNPVEDNTCDVCGRYDPTGIWPSQAVKGPVTIYLGRCDDCVPAHVRRRTP